MADDLRRWLGEKLRVVRKRAGYTSADALARDLGYERTALAKAETGDRVPSPDLVMALMRKFPELATAGSYDELADVARASDAKSTKYPGWFGKAWFPIERESTSLRGWEPQFVPGLLQAPGYAAAVIRGCEPAMAEKEREAVLSERLERQAVLDGEHPPELRALIDEMVLHRPIGSPEVMREQIMHLVDMSRREMVTLQVLPAALGVHRGLLGAFSIAEPSGTVYMETAIDSQITGDKAMHDYAALVFDRLTRDALPRGASRDLMLKVANEQWNT
jgi:DNA-binding XRE family transcriptional regulator